MELFDSALFWLILGVICIIIEFVTPGLFYSAILGVSSLLTSGLALFIHQPVILILVFFLLSIAGVFIAKPILSRTLGIDKTVRLSNDEALIGKTGFVTQLVSPEKKGEVRVQNETWTAASTESLPEGTEVVITGISGATLQVKRSGTA